MLQKTCTEDFMTGKKAKNVGQCNKYYVSNSHPVIIISEVFDMVQVEMDKRSRLIYKEDGTVESRERKYNGKYILGNLLVCGYCGASYRRRTERGKIVWRCGTRIEKGKELCANSPTLNEEWIKGILGETVCDDCYFEEIVRNRVERVIIFNQHIEIIYKDANKISILFIENEQR